jgi:plastocyanin
MRKPYRILIVACGAAVVLTAVLWAAAAGPAADPSSQGPSRARVIIPGEDRFTPFNLTIHAGTLVVWVNQDTDDHTIVSDDNFSTTGPRKLNILIPGTDNNGGKFGRYAFFFAEHGTFVYHCRLHSHLDDAQQPVAPGPKGGIQDATGNFGTPMMGTVTVLP